LNDGQAPERVDEDQLDATLKKTPEQLAQENMADVDMDASAKEALEQEGNPVYDLHRVEFTGVGTKNEGKWASYFQKYFFASHRAARTTEEQADWFDDTQDLTRDGRNALQEMRSPVLTERGKEVVAELKGKKIDEIYAHSWGSEVVYNAILNGDLLPPKRLVVIGVPERDLEKWRLLNQYTGSEVIFVRSSRDAVQLGGETLRRSSELTKDLAAYSQNGWMNAKTALALAELVVPLPAQISDVEKLWAARKGVRAPIVAAKEDGFKVLQLDSSIYKGGHDKDAYHGFLAQEKLLAKPWISMQKEQESLLARKKDELWQNAVSQANAELSKARELKASIEADREQRRIEQERQEELRKQEEARTEAERSRRQELQNAQELWTAWRRQLKISAEYGPNTADVDRVYRTINGPVYSQLFQEAEKCGFVNPGMWVNQDGIQLSFARRGAHASISDDIPRRIAFYFVQPETGRISLAWAKAQFLMADASFRTAAFASGYDRGPACNDALPIIRRDWSEDLFHDTMFFVGDGHNGLPELHAILALEDPPEDFEVIRKVVLAYRARKLDEELQSRYKSMLYRMEKKKEEQSFSGGSDRDTSNGYKWVPHGVWHKDLYLEPK
jgi:hypothetical protein